MSAETIEPPALITESHRLAFFRQSGWMMIASVMGGAFMYLVHGIAERMPKENGEYGLFMTLLQVVTQMGIPTIGLQSVFAQQAAAALTEDQHRQLAGAVRKVVGATFLIWAVMATGIFVWRHALIAALKITNPAALWITVVIALGTLWLPIVMGLLQGCQNFLWFGWTSIMNGVGRFVAIFVTVGLLGGYAAGAMTGVLVGLVTAILFGGWHVRDYLTSPTLPFAWREWLARVIPLTMGLGAAQFMLSADMIFVRHFFPEEQSVYYAAAGMIGRALVFFTLPLTWVMFPKLVRSAASAQKTDVLTQVLGVTALLGGMAAIACTIMPSLPLRIIYDKRYLAVATPLVPWFAWCMLPLTLSNVLINSLMARGRYAAAPWLVLVAAGYATSLYFFHDTLKMVIQTLGIFGLLLTGTCATFALLPHGKRSPGA